MILQFRAPADVRAVLVAVRGHLRAGKLLGYPTETVYGLGSAPRDDALTALAELKGRPTSKPFLLLVASRTMAEKWGLHFTPGADALARAFWPGPLTLALKGGEGKLPEMLRGPEGGIAVRHTSQKQVAALIEALGEPLTSTSANRPGQQPAPGAVQLAELFAAEVTRGELLILDGGALGNAPPSTLVDCTASEPRLIREGAIPRQELRRAVGSLAE